MSVKITEDIKTDLYAAIEKELHKLTELEGVAGILAKDGMLKKKDAEGKARGSTVIGVGYLHEFGNPDSNLPERSFIRSAHISSADDLNELAQEYILDLLEGKIDARKMLEELAEEARNAILEQFETEGEGAWPKLKFRDGKALQDTGQLMQSIHAQVRRRR